MRAFYYDRSVLPLTERHRIPMEKYPLLREGVTRRADVPLTVPEAATSEELDRVHATGYVEAVQGPYEDRFRGKASELDPALLREAPTP